MVSQAAEVTGTILHLQRLSTEDGPGIRTTVFFKGCPLHCAWCHNPESLSLNPQVQWIGNRCIGCECCIEVCEEHGLTRTAEGILRDRALCVICGRCVDACPIGLRPYQMKHFCDAGDFEGAKAHDVLECILCGACSYSCPAKRWLTASFKLAKDSIAAAQRRKKS